MELWLVRDVPAWVVGVVLIVGLPALMLGLDKLIHRVMAHGRLSEHNLVTGVVVSVVGVAYGIMIGMCVVTLWAGLGVAEDDARDEAANLAALVPASRVFGAETEQRMAAEVVRYNTDVIDGWSQRAEGIRSDKVTDDLARIADLIGELRPTTEAQQAYVNDAIARLGEGQELRQQSLFAATDQQMSSVMWLGVICATIAILGLLLLFGIADDTLRRILLTLASVVVATNLYLVVEMNYPYFGSFSVDTSSYEQVNQDLRAP